jgi:hypothetical protein
MAIRPIKRFVVSQRDAILVALAFAAVLVASGALAVERPCVTSALGDPQAVGTLVGGHAMPKLTMSSWRSLG